MKPIDALKEIISLSRKVRLHLDKNDIKKATGELNLIIQFDLEELRTLQSEHGDLRLLIECKNVLSLAKKALMQLESSELTDDAKSIIDKIIEIEEHELLEMQDHEKKLNFLYRYWHENFFNGVFYHGTSSLAIEKIKKYGIVPGMVPWNRDEIILLDFLIKKSGYSHGIGAFYNSATLEREGAIGIFLTVRKQSAINYAKRSPEMWTEFVGEKNWARKDKRQSVKEVYSLLIYRGAANRRMPVPQYNEILNLCDADMSKFSVHLRELCPLSNKEINEVIRIFNKYWEFFSNAKPILIMVSAQAPAIVKRKPEYGSFNGFLSFSHIPLTETFKEITLQVEFLKDLDIDLKITERIPARYIVDIEEV